MGCFVGLILSYTGLSTFISGALSGVILQSSYPNIGNHFWMILYSWYNLLATNKTMFHASHHNKQESFKTESLLSTLTQTKIDNEILDTFSKIHHKHTE
jgi:hypothetical protein